MRRVLASELVQRLNDVTDRLREEARHLTARTKHFDLAKGHSAERPRVRRISSPTELDTIFREIAFDSILGDIAAELVGGAVKFYHSKLNFKSPEGGAEIGWHQDWPVLSHEHESCCAERAAKCIISWQRVPAHDCGKSQGRRSRSLVRRTVHVELQSQHDGR